MKMIHGLLTFVAVIVCRAISWVLIIKWHLPVHYSELQTEDKLKTTFFDLARFRLFSSDTRTFIDDVVSRVDTPVIPIPDSNTINVNQIPEKKYSTKGRPKSWWSSEERSATMELSYLTAVVDSKLVLFTNPQGVTIQQSIPSPSPTSTPRDSSDSLEQPDTRKSNFFRDRRAARDWDAMPEVVKQSQGRFQLKGGKCIYTDADLSKSIEQRHLALSHRTRRGFGGWNKHVAPFSKPQQEPHEELKTSSSDIESDNFENGISLADCKSKLPSNQKVKDLGNKNNSVEKDNEPIKQNVRRGTAQLDYNDFLPSSRPRSTDRTPLPSLFKQASATALLAALSPQSLSSTTTTSINTPISNSTTTTTTRPIRAETGTSTKVIATGVTTTTPTTISSQSDLNQHETSVPDVDLHHHDYYKMKLNSHHNNKQELGYENDKNRKSDDDDDADDDMIWEVNPSRHNTNYM